jgi:hypothetical protein
MPCVVILEDDPMRVAGMRRVLGELLPDVKVVAFDAVPPLVEFLEREGDQVVLISLDHDLTREGCAWGSDERGDGRGACEFLASRQPTCPVIVHSSNYGAAGVMIEVLRGAGWRLGMVTPFSEVEYEWVGREWRSVVQRLL